MLWAWTGRLRVGTAEAPVRVTGVGPKQERRMRIVGDIHTGQTVRLMSPYFDAARGIYAVVYVYRNGWVGVVSYANGRRYNVPGYLCRPVDVTANSGKRQSDLSL